jgi:hypothetical protein
VRDPDEFMNRLLSSPEQTWHVPEDAVIRPGTGENIWHGLTITHWSQP